MKLQYPYTDREIIGDHCSTGYCRVGMGMHHVQARKKTLALSMKAICVVKHVACKGHVKTYRIFQHQRSGGRGVCRHPDSTAAAVVRLTSEGAEADQWHRYSSHRHCWSLSPVVSTYINLSLKLVI